HPRLERTPVLLISGIVNAAVVDRAARVGSAGVMQKPFSADELAGKVSHLLGLAGPVPSGPALADGGTASTASRAPVTPDAVTRAVCVPPSERSAPALATCLAGLAAADGVHSVALTDRDGQLIGSAGNGSDVTTLGALTACLLSASDQLGTELGRG